MSASETSSAHAPTKKRRLRRLSWIGSRLLSAGLFFATGVMLLALLGLAQRLHWIRADSDRASAPAASADGGTIHTCPMHPNIRQPSPGRCPICGMELVPASHAGGASLDEFAVRIEPAQRRLANIETAEVQSEAL